MAQFGWRFGSLYWRLTVSYFLVTLVAALVIVGAGAVISHLSDFQQSHGNPSAQAVRWVSLDTASRVDQVAPIEQVAPYLEQSTPDQSALQNWVIPHLFAYLQQNKGNDVPLIAIVDRGGSIVASGSCAASVAQSRSCLPATVSQTMTMLESSRAQQVTRAALAGDLRPADTATATPGGSVEAVPIRSYGGQVLGALVLVFAASDLKGNGGDSIGQGISAVSSAFFSTIGSAQFYFALFAIAIGTLSGVLLSRNLRRRLLAIARAADAWSGGEFQTVVRDASSDEIGQLARHLDDMARQLDTLLTTREALAVVEERNRLARELHDSVKQHVFAIALLVRSARARFERGGELAVQHLAEAEELATQAQQELTTLIRALRPAALADKGLVPVLRDYISDWSRRAGISADLRVQGERATPLDAEEALLRVAQEALANVARHSSATAVELRLVWEGDAMSLAIEDNGLGFHVARAEGAGLGLASMRERVETLGGALSLESASGRTVVSARMPLPEQAADPKGVPNG